MLYRGTVRSYSIGNGRMSALPGNVASGPSNRIRLLRLTAGFFSSRPQIYVIHGNASIIRPPPASLIARN